MEYVGTTGELKKVSPQRTAEIIQQHSDRRLTILRKYYNWHFS